MCAESPSVASSVRVKSYPDACCRARKAVIRRLAGSAALALGTPASAELLPPAPAAPPVVTESEAPAPRRWHLGAAGGPLPHTDYSVAKNTEAYLGMCRQAATENFVEAGHAGRQLPNGYFVLIAHGCSLVPYP